MPPLKIPASVRKQILKKLLTSPERKALYRKVKGPIEKILTKEDKLEKAYLIGSFVSKKKAPSDIDMLGFYKDLDASALAEFRVRKKYLKENEAKAIRMEKQGKEYKNKYPLEFHTYPASREHKTDVAELREMVNVAKKRYGKDYKWIRLASITGALGAGGLLTTNDKAEAAPMEGVVKAGTKMLLKQALKGEESSAAKKLAGFLYQGKVIKNITKGKGDWRYIIFEDDSVEAVEKGFINSLARKKGTDVKMVQFEVGNKQSKLTQAYKSLQYHKTRGNSDKQLVLNYANNYKQQFTIRGEKAPELTLVESEGLHFTMPKPYADLLQKEGAIRKIKDL